MDGAWVEAPCSALVGLVSIKTACRDPLAVFVLAVVDGGEADVLAGCAAGDDDAKSFADAEKFGLPCFFFVARHHDEAIAGIGLIAEDLIEGDLDAVVVHGELDVGMLLGEVEAVDVTLGLLLEEDGGNGVDGGVAVAEVGSALDEVD